MSPDELKDEIGRTRKLTSRPFGVNLILTVPLAEEKLAVVIGEAVRVLTVGAGNAGPIVRKAQGSGLTVIPVVASVSLAVRMERAGAAAVIAEGYESGGHVGELTTMALIAMVSRAVIDPGDCGRGDRGRKGFGFGACPRGRRDPDGDRLLHGR